MQGPRYFSSDSRRVSLTATLCGLLLVPALIGCQSSHVVSADADGRPQFEQLTIVYDLVEPTVTPASGTEPLTLEYAKSHPWKSAVISRASRVSDDHVRSELRLTVQSPHPAGDPETALVTLSAPRHHSGTWQVVGQQAISRTQTDLLFVHLVNGGVCDSETRQESGVRIAVDVDGHRIQKPWTREPRLDRLAVETLDAAQAAL